MRPSKIPVRTSAKKVVTKSLYDRLEGLYPIADLVNRFSEAILADDLVGRRSPNPALRAWSVQKAPTRLAGLIHQRTEWLCQVAGGPQRYVPTREGPSGPLDLESAHCPLALTALEFDRVAEILQATLRAAGVQAREEREVLAAFAAHKSEVIFGSSGHGCPFALHRV